MSTAFCLDCDCSFDLDHNFKVGQRVACPRCETKFEVVSLDPPELDWVYEGPTINLSLFDRAWGDFKMVDHRLDFENGVK